MGEIEFQTRLLAMRNEWGGVFVDPQSPGVIRATLDPSTGVLVGIKAPLFAEILNRALTGVKS